MILSLAAISTTAFAAGDVRFLVFGDAPYTEKQIDVLKNTIAPAIQSDESLFLIHVGDMKSSNESCTDALIQERFEQLLAFKPGRVFYTPGDNDWTDCDRPKLSQRFSELNRLEYLRDLILSRPMKLPASWHYATQRKYPENARWTQGNVIFATIHMVGDNDGRQEILLDDIDNALDLVDARSRANQVWLRAAFDTAIELNAGAVVVATQADVTELAGTAPCSVDLRIRCDAFATFRDQLLRLAASFKRPVLLVHGDTNPFCVDKKFGGDTAPLLWRLNALGDYSEVDATVISVQLHNPEQPFWITPMLTGASVGMTCS